MGKEGRRGTHIMKKSSNLTIVSDPLKEHTPFVRPPWFFVVVGGVSLANVRGESGQGL